MAPGVAKTIAEKRDRFRDVRVLREMKRTQPRKDPEEINWNQVCGVLGTMAGVCAGATVAGAQTASLSIVGGVATTSINGSPVTIVRVSVTSFITLSRVCPHQGSTVNATSTGFKCPNHGAWFDSAGIWVGGQRTTNMRSYTTTYDSAAGTLTIG